MPIQEGSANSRAFKELIENKQSRTIMADKVVLSRKNWIDGNVLEILRFAWAVDKQSLIDAFKKEGIAVSSEEDLERLSLLHDKGLSKSGELKARGVNVTFDLWKIIKSINIPDEKVKKANIKFI